MTPPAGGCGEMHGAAPLNEQRASDRATGSSDLGNVLVVMDFDGTITTDDCMEAVLSRHVVGWRSIAAAARAEGLSDLAVIERGVHLLRLPREQIVGSFIDLTELRPGFQAFAEWVLAGEGRAAVASAGIREAIEAVWRAADLPCVPVYASELLGTAESGFRLVPHERFGDCPICGRRRCKGALTRSLRRADDVVVAFGDGARDLCMAREADLVFARGRLLELCERDGIAAMVFEDFGHAAADVTAWLRRDAGRSRPASTPGR